jgi:subtilisin family serine protease
MSGTSMASPTVAGVAALLVSKDPTLLPSAVACRLSQGASAIGTAPNDSPTRSYSFDGVREGVVSAPGALALTSCSP